MKFTTFDELNIATKIKLSTAGQRVSVSGLKEAYETGVFKTDLQIKALQHATGLHNQTQTQLGDCGLRTPAAADRFYATGKGLLETTHAAHIKACSSTNDLPYQGVNHHSNMIMQGGQTNMSYGNETMSQEAYSKTVLRNKKAAFEANKGIERSPDYKYAGKDSTSLESRTKMRKEYIREQVDANRTRLNNQIKAAINESVRSGIIAGLTAGIYTFVDHTIDVLVSYINLEINKQQMIEYMKQIAKDAIIDGLKAAGVALVLSLLDKLLMAIIPAAFTQVYAAVKSVLAVVGIVNTVTAVIKLAHKLYELVKLYFTSDSPHAFKAHVEKAVSTIETNVFRRDYGLITF